MGYAGFSDIRVTAAFWICVVSTLLAVALLLEVLRMRLTLMVRVRRSRRFRDNAQSWLIRLIAGEDFDLPKIARQDLPDFLYLWIHFQEILRGDSKFVLNQVLRAAELDSKIRKLLHTGRLEDQMIAATVLGHLGDIQAWEQLLVLLKKPSPMLSMTALRALVLIDPEKASDICMPLIVRHRDWMPVRMASLLRQADPQFQQAFLSYVEREAGASPPYLPRLMRLFDALPENRPLPLVGKLMESGGDPELLAVCLRLVCHPSELEAVRRCYSDKRWLVQVRIAGLLARIGGPRDVHYLLTLLDSDHWWVRYRAAQAMLALPFINRQAVKRLIENRSDDFARDMLLQTLAEKVRP